MSGEQFRAGFVAVVGRPNTGKSTLINTLVNEKISIVTSKAQTTRHQILGILTDERRQIIFVDTPGFHASAGKLINRAMNRAAVASLTGADVALLVIEATSWRKNDDYALEKIAEAGIPAILVINKVDLTKQKSALLPFIASCSERYGFTEIVPVSASRQDNLDRLMGVIEAHLPVSSELFPADMKTDKSLEFRIAEALREKLLESLHAEVPYGLAVEIAELEQRNDLILAEAVIWVERQSQKGIVIGQSGDKLKYVGTAARKDLETVFGKRFHLQTRVKVKENWSDNARALRQLGYEVGQ
jgi:GTP-binding protein Era